MDSEPIRFLGANEIIDLNIASTNKSQFLHSWIDKRFPVFVYPSFKNERVFIYKINNEFKILKDNDEQTELRPLSLPEIIRMEKVTGNYVLQGSIVKKDNSDRILVEDILLNENENLVDKSLGERRKILREFFDTKLRGNNSLGLMEAKQINDSLELTNHLEKIASDKNLSGAIIKEATSKFLINETNPNWLELKKIESEESNDDLKTIDTSLIKDDSDLLIMAAMGFTVVEKSLEKEKDEELTQIMKIGTLNNIPEKRFVLGVVTEPFTMDEEGHIMTPEAIEDMAHYFMSEHRVIGIIHEVKAQARLVESYITRVDMEINGTFVKKGSWIIGVIIDDETTWEAVKDGLINGFSVGGFAKEKDLN